MLGSPLRPIRKVFALTGKTFPVVITVDRQLSTNAPFSNHACPIAVVPQLHRKGIIKLFGSVRGAKVVDTMSSCVLPRHISGSTDCTDGGRTEHIFESHSLARELINGGSLNDVVPHAAQGIPALVIRQNKNDIRTICCGHWLKWQDIEEGNQGKTDGFEYRTWH